MVGIDENPLHPRFRELLIGQEAAEAEFLAAHNSENLHHAWLISAAKGMGKATLAYKIARFLLANPPSDGNEPGLFGDAPPKAQSLDVEPDHPVAQ